MYKQHKKIHRFQYSGLISDDSYIPRMRAAYEKLLVDDIKSRGYLPCLDIDTAFSTQYNEENQYKFIISIYGIYVGKKVAECSEGIYSGKVITNSAPTIQNTKSSQSSMPSA